MRQANNRAKHKTEILLDKIEKNSDLEDLVEDYLVSNIDLFLSPLVWANIGILEDTILIGKPDRTVKVSVGSSSNS